MKNFCNALKFILFMFLGWGIFGFGHANVAHAFDLVDFIAQPNFSPHTLSTGEFIWFSDEGGASSLGQPVRQYKNGNWEQFYIGTDWIYRREDTSWQVNGIDPLCSNGNRAIYTLDRGSCVYPEGTVPHSDGAGWAPARNNSEGQTWTGEMHNIVPIDSGVGPNVYAGYQIAGRSDLRSCQLSNGNQVGNYPACNMADNTGQITGYYDVGEFTFCSGITNPAPVVTISGTSGAGAGEGFAYMQGCGLVGFNDNTMRVGIVSGCGVDEAGVNTSNCTQATTVGPDEGIPRVLSGKVVSDKPLTETVMGKSVEITNAPVTGATVCAYGGTWDTAVGKRGGMINNLEGSAVTNRAGEFNLNTMWRVSGPRASFEESNYVAVYCGARLVDVYKVGLACGDVALPTFVIDCDRYTSPLTACPSFLPYADRNGHLMCTSQGPQRGIASLWNEVAPRIWVNFRTGQHIGDNPADVPEWNNMFEVEPEGRYSVTNFLAALEYKITPQAVLMGGPTDHYKTEKEGQDPVLPSCESINASGANEIGVLRTGNANDAIRWSVGVTLATPSFEGGGIPGDIRRLVETTNPETIVCKNFVDEEVPLSAFKPPYIKDCAGYTYCDGYPYQALSGDRTPQNQALKSKTADDPMENEGDVARVELFSDDPGHQPFVSDSIPRIPHSDIASRVTSNAVHDNPVPAFVVDTPGTTRGWDETVTQNTTPDELRLPEATNRFCKVWRMGIQQAMCTCSDLDGDCAAPLNTFHNNDEGNPYVSGWDYCDEEGGDCEIFYGAQVSGLARFFAGLLQSILAWFNPAPQCSTERTVATCISSIDSSPECQPFEIAACHAGDPSVTCTWNEPEYTCEGEWDYRLLGSVSQIDHIDSEGGSQGATRDAEVSAGLAEFALSLSPPCTENEPECKEMQDLCGVDSRSTSEKNPGDLEGVGADMPCTTSAGTSIKQQGDMVRRMVRDPETRNTSDPGPPVPPGTGSPGPIGSGVCNGAIMSGYFSGVSLSPIGNYNAILASITTSTLVPTDNMTLEQVYAAAEDATGVPCEILAGIHYVEANNSPTGSLISGRTIGDPEPDQGGIVFNTLLESAIRAGEVLKGKVGGTIDSYEELVEALALYNGPGNANCGRTPYGVAPNPGICPPPFPGHDHIYPMSKVDSIHETMYLVYCADRTTCNPPREYTRYGVIGVAYMYYVSH